MADITKANTTFEVDTAYNAMQLALPINNLQLLL